MQRAVIADDGELTGGRDEAGRERFVDIEAPELFSIARANGPQRSVRLDEAEGILVQQRRSDSLHLVEGLAPQQMSVAIEAEHFFPPTLHEEIIAHRPGTADGGTSGKGPGANRRKIGGGNSVQRVCIIDKVNAAIQGDERRDDGAIQRAGVAGRQVIEGVMSQLHAEKGAPRVGGHRNVGLNDDGIGPLDGLSGRDGRLKGNGDLAAGVGGESK
jgi:hypothetical protein